MPAIKPATFTITAYGRMFHKSAEEMPDPPFDSSAKAMSVYTPAKRMIITVLTGRCILSAIPSR